MKQYKYAFICTVCNTNHKSCDPNQKLCSNDCRYKKYNRRVSQYNNLPTTTVGVMSEMYVVNDLLSKGYAVFRSVSQSAYCDIIAVKDFIIEQIEVRTGYYNFNGTLAYPKTIHKSNGIPTKFGIYIHETKEVKYFDVTQEHIEKYSKENKKYGIIDTINK